MQRCDTWKSSYQLAPAVLQELDIEPVFGQRDLYLREGEEYEDVVSDALWDVFFCRLGSVQEYGFHAGIQELMWTTDSLNRAMSDFDWKILKSALEEKRTQQTLTVIRHAESENEYFPDSAGPLNNPHF